MHPVYAEEPGDLVTVDFYGPLPQSTARTTYIFVVIDSFTKFVKLYPVRRAQAKIAVKKIVDDFHQIIPCKVILSDHGSQFQSHHWQNTLKSHDIQPTFSSIRHPQSNPTERVMKELSRLFRTYCLEAHTNWCSLVPNIEHLFNITPHISTGYSPFEILQGENPADSLFLLFQPFLPAAPRKSLDEIRADARVNLRTSAERRKTHGKSRSDILRLNDLVLLRESPVSNMSDKIIAKFCPLYSGPYVVTDSPHPNVYTLKDPDTWQHAVGPGIPIHGGAFHNTNNCDLRTLEDFGPNNNEDFPLDSNSSTAPTWHITPHRHTPCA